MPVAETKRGFPHLKTNARFFRLPVKVFGRSVSFKAGFCLRFMDLTLSLHARYFHLLSQGFPRGLDLVNCFHFLCITLIGQVELLSNFPIIYLHAIIRIDAICPIFCRLMFPEKNFRKKIFSFFIFNLALYL